MAEKKTNKQGNENKNEFKWYVIHTYSGYENKVATNIEKVVENRKLEDFIKEIKVPTQKVIEIKDNKKREVERKLYPGYVLVKMILTDDSWYVVRNTTGVTGFVGTDSKPVPLKDEEIDYLGVGLDNGKKDVDFQEKDTVKIMYGSLNGYNGEIKSIDIDKGIAVVFVSMFGRKTPVEIELEHLEKV